ncbi:surface-related antigen SRA, putative [Plasmodium chabaudi chabaudi]|uniref:Surface-related antigen SRA, putative n=1 Tax=Plasmodium chabaudi chabaudi TaxID=31271 RepID=A0A4V0K358_PLACU|nr:surface-related antigen SRA, putative [Plasmodium chabaudi chabaudi]VTZ66478.1 surface-related antigen SRA, putative [Plasmodium chabaudi chabaudi]|eukprot:XP_016655548.1 conserved Plasmodium protein, unknown function [Plasmodium chabaudi chabaudi]
MILHFKIRPLILLTYLYMSFVNSNKHIQNTLSPHTLSQNIQKQLYSKIVSPLTNVNITNPILNGRIHKKDNKHTCEAAGCSSYKNIIKNNDTKNSIHDDCLDGFICKKCKKTHAKNSNICFYSNLEGYQNLYDALLEEYTVTPYDDFKIPLNKSTKKDDDNENGETKQGGDENSEKQDEDDEGKDDDNKDSGKKKKKKKNDDDDDDESDEDEKETKKKNSNDDDDDIAFFERKENTNSYQSLNKINEYAKNSVNQNGIKLGEKAKHKHSNNKHGQLNVLSPFVKNYGFTPYSTNDYSFLFEENKKSEKIVYKRLKININKYEEYLKSKLNKCDVSNDGMITIYIKLLLQIVKDKKDIYVDISKQSILSSKTENKSHHTKNEKQKNDDDSTDDENESENDSDSDDDDFYGSNKKKSNNYSYLEILNLGNNNNATTNQPLKYDGQSFPYKDMQKKLSTSSYHLNEKEKNKINTTDKTIIQNITKYNFYQERLRDDSDGDSMGNYYKSKNGFFKSLFSKVYRKKSDDEYDDYDSDSSSDDDSEYGGKKRKRFRLFSWKKKNKNKQHSRKNKNDDEEEDDDKYSNKKYDDENEENDDSESKENKKSNNDVIAKDDKKKSKIKAFFSKIKNKILPEKQKLHIEAFFNSIIVKSCKNSIKWEGKMFKKKALVELTLKVPVKMKYIEDEPLSFFRSGFETILTCHNCNDIIFNSCVQVYCTKKNEYEHGKDNEMNQTQNKANDSASTAGKSPNASQLPYIAGASVLSSLPAYQHNNYYPGNTSMSHYNTYSGGICNYFSYLIFLFIFLLSFLAI